MIVDAAAAHREDERAAVWADLGKVERDAALKNVEVCKANLAAANKLTGAGSTRAKELASQEYAKVKDVVPRLAHAR